MSWNTSYKSGQDNYNTKYESFPGGSSSEQAEQAEQSETPSEQNPWEKMAEEVMNEEPHTVVSAHEKAENVKKGAESEKIEETVPNKNLEELSSGERTKIYRIQNENGEGRLALDSDYPRLAEDFMGSHPELKLAENTDLNLAFMGLSSDLAMIDATQGKNFTGGAENLRESLTDDYKNLAEKLNNPDTPAKEKQLISEYFKVMRGDALSFLESRYSKVEEKHEETEEDVERKRFEEEFESVKKQLDNARNKVEEDAEMFNRLTKELDDAYHADEDIEFLQAKLNNIKEALETLYSDNKEFSNANAHYDVLLAIGNKFLDQQAESERQVVSSNAEYARENAKKVDLAEEQIKQIGSQIVILRELKTKIYPINKKFTERKEVDNTHEDTEAQIYPISKKFAERAVAEAMHRYERGA